MKPPHLLAAAVLVVAGLLAAAVPASAHVTPTTYGSTYTAGVTNTFFLQVPHSCEDPDTTNSPNGTALTSKLVVTVPSALASVKPQFIPGWTLSTVKSGTGAVTEITWQASSAAFAVPDTAFLHFGIRATINGQAGDKVLLPTLQHCDYHENGTPATGLVESWTGADTPTLTLVAREQGVNNAAQVAEVKAKAAQIDAVKLVVDELLAKMNFLIVVSQYLVGKSNGDLAASISGGRLNISADLSATLRGRSVDITANGRRVGSGTLNAAGDVATSVPATGIVRGSTIGVRVGGFTLASTTL